MYLLIHLKGWGAIVITIDSNLLKLTLHEKIQGSLILAKICNTIVHRKAKIVDFMEKEFFYLQRFHQH